MRPMEGPDVISPMAEKTPPRICMVVYSYFPADNRVRREALALQNAGYQVDVVCLREGEESLRETFKGIDVVRLPQSKKRGGVLTYMKEYTLFLLRSLLTVTSLHRRNRYQVLHAHNPPDFLILCGALPRILSSTRLVLDIHEPLARMYASRFGKSLDALLIRLIDAFQVACCRLSDRVITISDAIKDDLDRSGAQGERITVVTNTPDEEIFLKDRTVRKEDLGLGGKHVLLYQGAVLRRRGVDTLVRALPRIRESIPNALLLIVGDGDDLPRIKQLVEELGCAEAVRFTGWVPLTEVPRYMLIADLCVISARLNPTYERYTPVKLFEYIEYNRPILATRLQALVDVITEDGALFYAPDDDEDLAKKVLWAWSHPGELARKTHVARSIYEAKYRWSTVKDKLLNCYADLLGMEGDRT